MSSSSIQSWFHKASVAMSAGNYERAVRCAENGIAAEPNNALAYYYLAESLRQLDRERDALPHFCRALELDPCHASSFVGLAYVHLELKSYDQGVEAANSAIELAPTNSGAHAVLAYLLVYALRPREAIEAADAALALNPRNVNALNAKGNALSRLSRNAEAEQCYLQSLAIMPEHVESLTNLGLVQRGSGRRKSAVNTLKTALRVDANYSSARELLLNSSWREAWQYYRSVPEFVFYKVLLQYWLFWVAVITLAFLVIKDSYFR
ncbi:tetratricopeptide repeat protein [Aeoliella sp.]|uniref:tetratricopeptide repeat protein n=1 Tax=Aeoliella sp. TaxID=2795800 RepID=UPI003CCC249F